MGSRYPRRTRTSFTSAEVGAVYLDRRDLHLKAEGDALVLYVRGKREGTLPIRPMERLVVVGNVTLEAAVLHRLARHGVSLLLLWGRRPRFSARLQGRLHRNGALRVEQYRLSLQEDFRLAFSRSLVLRKLGAMRDLLSEVLSLRTDLTSTLRRALLRIEEGRGKAEGAQSVESLRGHEGAASAAYFEALSRLFPAGLSFRGRNRRPPRDPVNAMLSLCYTLLHWEMVREIELAGLDPYIGFYHDFDYGRESLACDLVEPWRPEVDRLVWRLFAEEGFSRRHFRKEGEAFYLKKEGRSMLWPLYEGWARERRPLWREEVRGLVRTLMAGQDPLFAGEERDLGEERWSFGAGDRAGEGSAEGPCEVDR